MISYYSRYLFTSNQVFKLHNLLTGYYQNYNQHPQETSPYL